MELSLQNAPQTTNPNNPITKSQYIEEDINISILPTNSPPINKNPQVTQYINENIPIDDETKSALRFTEYNIEQMQLCKEEEMSENPKIQQGSYRQLTPEIMNICDVSNHELPQSFKNAKSDRFTQYVKVDMNISQSQMPQQQINDQLPQHAGSNSFLQRNCFSSSQNPQQTRDFSRMQHTEDIDSNFIKSFGCAETLQHQQHDNINTTDISLRMSDVFGKQVNSNAAEKPSIVMHTTGVTNINITQTNNVQTNDNQKSQQAGLHLEAANAEVPQAENMQMSNSFNEESYMQQTNSNKRYTQHQIQNMNTSNLEMPENIQNNASKRYTQHQAQNMNISNMANDQNDFMIMNKSLNKVEDNREYETDYQKAQSMNLTSKHLVNSENEDLTKIQKTEINNQSDFMNMSQLADAAEIQQYQRQQQKDRLTVHHAQIMDITVKDLPTDKNQSNNMHETESRPELIQHHISYEEPNRKQRFTQYQTDNMNISAYDNPPNQSSISEQPKVVNAMEIGNQKSFNKRYTHIQVENMNISCHESKTEIDENDDPNKHSDNMETISKPIENVNRKSEKSLRMTQYQTEHMNLNETENLNISTEKPKELNKYETFKPKSLTRRFTQIQQENMNISTVEEASPSQSKSKLIDENTKNNEIQRYTQYQMENMNMTQSQQQAISKQTTNKRYTQHQTEIMNISELGDTSSPIISSFTQNARKTLHFQQDVDLEPTSSTAAKLSLNCKLKSNHTPLKGLRQQVLMQKHSDSAGMNMEVDDSMLAYQNKLKNKTISSNLNVNTTPSPTYRAIIENTPHRSIYEFEAIERQTKEQEMDHQLQHQDVQEMEVRFVNTFFKTVNFIIF